MTDQADQADPEDGGALAPAKPRRYPAKGKRPVSPQLAEARARKPTGRPIVHGPEVEIMICELLADGKHLTEISKMPGMPSVGTILGWAAGDRPGFGEAYARAREALATRLVAEALALVDQPVKDGAEASALRTRADMRKWLASKLFPQRYGDKVEQTVQQLGADGKPVDPARPVFTVLIQG